MIFQNKSLVGLDIGHSTIKLAQVEVSGKQTKVNSFSLIATPNIDEEDPAFNLSEKLSQAIKELVAESKVKKKKVATAVWGNSVIVKKVTFAEADESMIAEQIEWEAERYIPYDLADVSLTYKILKSSVVSGTTEVLLIAAVKEDVFRCAEVVEMSGLNCSVLDVPGFALANCFEKSVGVKNNENIALFNIGSAVTQFVVINGEEVQFCRDIPIGGELYTRELIKTLNISFEEAEMLKINANLNEPAQEVDSVLISTHKMICSEIQDSISFFQSTNENSIIQNCYLTGGGCLTKGLLHQVNEVIPSQFFDPFGSLSVNKKNLSDDYIDSIKAFSAIALGLAMRKEGDND